jgi:predicted nucleic acid-binding protein
MRFWDSSAILGMLFAERTSSAVSNLYTQDPAQTVWCLTEIEVASALSRRVREGMPDGHAADVRESWRRLATHWSEVVSVDLVRPRAVRLVNTHPLRAGDALQLAAAIVASGERPGALSFVCLDDRLREAARKEGFPVLPA